jgi:ATP-dependent Clp endopeptidase proteolytic subunit ClpP
MREAENQYWIVNKLDSNTAEILIYGEIGNWGDNCVNANGFVKELKALEKSCSLINLRINSNGGNVYEGIAIFNAIKNSKTEIDAYVDGIAASMATLIAMACRKVYMSKYARFMTHRPSGGAWGTAEELRAVATEIDALEVIGNKMYQEKTGLSETEVSAKFLNGKDNFFSAAIALQEKLIDGIYDGEQVDIPTNITDKARIWTAYSAKLEAKLKDNHETKILNVLS